MYDVLIIGAGPAGSTTAYYLARHGVKVGLLEKATFPRPKACGDILAPTAVEIIDDMGLRDIVSDYVPPDNWRLNFGAERDFQVSLSAFRDNGERRWGLAPRLELDAALAACAQQAGAELLEGVTVTEYTSEKNRAVIYCDGMGRSSLDAQLVIVAQGSSGRLIRPRSHPGIAVRGYYEGPPGQPMAIRWRPELLPGGYEWQFAITETLYNIGVGTLRSTSQKGSLRLDRWLGQSALTLDKHRVGQLRGGMLNYDFAFGHPCTHGDRTLWVGDAAGLVQPHLGEGIGQAMLSGRLAASSATKALERRDFTANILASYTEALHSEFDKMFGFARWIFNLTNYPQLWRRLGSLVAHQYSNLSSVAGFLQALRHKS